MNQPPIILIKLCNFLSIGIASVYTFFLFLFIVLNNSWIRMFVIIIFTGNNYPRISFLGKASSIKVHFGWVRRDSYNLMDLNASSVA